MSELFTHSPFTEPGQKPEQPAEDGAPLVPPPPEESMEVTIRTMQSDLELVAKGGMAAPLPSTTVSITPGRSGGSSSKIKMALWAAGIIFGAGAVFAAGYFLLPTLFPAVSEQEPLENTPGLPAANIPNPVPEPVPEAPQFTHASFFRRLPEASVIIELETSTDRGHYEEAVAKALLGVPATSTFIEAEVRIGGRASSWTEFARITGIVIPEENFWSSRLEDDFTMFLFRENKEYWPGYVLKRRESQSALLVKGAMLRLEEDGTRLRAFFLKDPKARKGGFADVQIGGQPFRQLAFEVAGANLIYGWIYNNYFIISSSEAGFRRTLEQF